MCVCVCCVSTSDCKSSRFARVGELQNTRRITTQLVSGLCAISYALYNFGSHALHLWRETQKVWCDNERRASRTKKSDHVGKTVEREFSKHARRDFVLLLYQRTIGFVKMNTI